MKYLVSYLSIQSSVCFRTVFLLPIALNYVFWNPWCLHLRLQMIVDYRCLLDQSELFPPEEITRFITIYYFMNNACNLLTKTIIARQLINKNSNFKFIVIIDSFDRLTAYPILMYSFEHRQESNCKFCIKSVLFITIERLKIHFFFVF